MYGSVWPVSAYEILCFAFVRSVGYVWDSRFGTVVKWAGVVVVVSVLDFYMLLVVSHDLWAIWRYWPHILACR